MKSNRAPILPLLLAVVVIVLWFFNRQLDGTQAWGGPGGSGVALAAGGDALTPPGSGQEGKGAEGESSSRQPVELEPPAPPPEATLGLEATEEVGSRLTGTVERPGGAPIAGATVVLRKGKPWFTPPADAEPMMAMGTPSPSMEALTDEAGQFEFFDVAPGKYSLALSAARFAPLGRHGLDVPVHENFVLGRFQMELGIQLEGRVLGAKGMGLEGVQVLSAISRDGGHTRLELPGLGVPLGITGPDGEFFVAGLAAGSWHLIFDAPGYRVNELKGTTEPAGQKDRNLLVSLESGLSIRGTVSGLDALTQGPLRVSARCAKDQPTGAEKDLGESERRRPRHCIVQADGSFEMTGLAAGVKYRLRLYREQTNGSGAAAEEAAEESEVHWVAVNGVEPIEELPGPGLVEFKYRAEAQVVLTPRDESTQGVLTHFSVQVTGSDLSGGGSLKGEDGETRTHFPGGEARFEGLRPAELGSPVTVRVTADGYADFLKNHLMLKPGETLTVVDVKLAPAPTGRVRVLDKNTGEPIAAARVAYSRAADASSIERALRAEGDLPGPTNTLRFATCDDNGVARLTLWEDQVCVLRAVATGFQKGEQKTLAPPYDEVPTLELVRGGQITITVTDDQGEPVPGMYVQHSIDGQTQRNNHYWDPDSGLENKTGEDGVVAFLNLPMGKHSFQVLESVGRYGRGSEDAGFEAQGDVYLEEGEQQELNLRVSARGNLVVTILEQGVALEGALTKLKPLDGPVSRGNSWFGMGNQDPRTQISDHAGRAHFKDIKVGEYLLRISHGERRMVVGHEVRIMRGDGELQLELGLATIEGRVTDPQGQPIVGVAMTVSDAQDGGNDRDMNDYRISIAENEDGGAEYEFEPIKTWTIRTDSEGRYELRGVAPELPLRVGAYHAHVVGKSREVGPLGSQEYVSPLDFTLERAGLLDMHLGNVDRNQREQYSFKICRLDGGTEVDAQTHPMRKWRANISVESLRPGKWRIRLFQTGVEEALDQREVEVRIGDTTKATLRP